MVRRIFRVKDVAKYENVAVAFGNVMPVIVGASGNIYRILKGQAQLDACVRSGYGELPVAIARAEGKKEQLQLTLLLSTIREEGGAISEGALISELVRRHGASRRELANLLGKSKAWLSKRETLAANLADGVKQMVQDGTVCARTAEEIAKLPRAARICQPPRRI
jgi:ParB-like chromosome segregation protein Spo0J